MSISQLKSYINFKKIGLVSFIVIIISGILWLIITTFEWNVQNSAILTQTAHLNLSHHLFIINDTDQYLNSNVSIIRPIATTHPPSPLLPLSNFMGFEYVNTTKDLVFVHIPVQTKYILFDFFI